MKKTKAAALAGTVLLYLFGLAVLIWVLPDRAVSRAERRRLEQRPSFSAGSFLSGAFAKNLETYFLDQFPGRDGWRAVQARLRFDLLRQRDSNGVYRRGDAVSRLEYPLAEKQVTHAAGKINWVMETYLAGSNVRFAVIPDKNYFMAGDAPHLDYGRMFALLDETVAAPRVDLSGCLQLEDYYRTDSHWRQERLLPVAQALADSFDLGVDLSPETGFAREELAPFYGVYCGQAAVDVEPDVLSYLRSSAIDAARMTGPELEGEQPVYTLDRFGGMDGYDVFCAGPQSVLTIESPLAKTDRELILFRDSFGSSLAPLLLEGYRRVTLVDLRYVASGLLDQFVDFHGQDVLFLYSTSLLNSGMLLK